MELRLAFRNCNRHMHSMLPLAASRRLLPNRIYCSDSHQAIRHIFACISYNELYVLFSFLVFIQSFLLYYNGRLIDREQGFYVITLKLCHLPALCVVLRPPLCFGFPCRPIDYLTTPCPGLHYHAPPNKALTGPALNIIYSILFFISSNVSLSISPFANLCFNMRRASESDFAFFSFFSLGFSPLGCFGRKLSNVLPNPSGFNERFFAPVHAVGHAPIV